MIYCKHDKYLLDICTVNVSGELCILQPVIMGKLCYFLPACGPCSDKEVVILPACSLCAGKEVVILPACSFCAGKEVVIPPIILIMG